MTTGIYLGGYPSDRFVVYRSYYYQLEIVGDSNDVDVVGDTITMWISRPLNYGITYVLNDYVIPWSSNRYTLDFIVYDCWWFFGGSGVHNAQAYTVNFWPRTADLIPTLSIIQPLGGIASFITPLPYQPSTWWTPLPYGI